MCGRSSRDKRITMNVPCAQVADSLMKQLVKLKLQVSGIARYKAIGRMAIWTQRLLQAF
jgi:hypothetical protein